MIFVSVLSTVLTQTSDWTLIYSYLNSYETYVSYGGGIFEPPNNQPGTYTFSGGSVHPKTVYGYSDEGGPNFSANFQLYSCPVEERTHPWVVTQAMAANTSLIIDDLFDGHDGQEMWKNGKLFAGRTRAWAWHYTTSVTYTGGE